MNPPAGLKRKKPSPSTDEPTEEDIRDRVLRLDRIKRKRIPAATLLSSGPDRRTIVSIGLPTKKGRVSEFDISEDGEAKKGKVVTEAEYLKGQKYNVYRLTTPVTLSSDGTVSPSRLGRNTIQIQDASEEEEEEGGDDDKKQTDIDMDMDEKGEEEDKLMKKTESGPNTPVADAKEDDDTPLDTQKETEQTSDNEKEEMKPTLDVENLEDPRENEDGMDVTDISDKANVTELDVKDTISEEIADMSAVKGDKPLPEEKERKSISKARYTPRGILEMQIEKLTEAALKEEDVDVQQTRFEKLKSLASDLAKFDKMPKAVKEVEKQSDMILESKENTIKEDTMEQVFEMKDAMESGEQRLSADNIAKTTPKQERTGAAMDVEPEDHLGGDIEAAAAKNVEPAITHHHQESVMDSDLNNHQSGIDGDVLMGEAGQIGQDNTPLLHNSSMASSANAQEATDMAVIIKGGELTKEEIKERREVMTAELKKGMKKLESDERNVPTKDPSSVLDQQLAEVGKDVPGFNQLAQQLTGITMKMKEGKEVPFDPTDITQKKQILEMLRKQNKITDVRTTEAPTTQDIFGRIVGKTAEEGGFKAPDTLGTSGLGTPVFIPSTSLLNLKELQSGVMTITDTEAKKIRDQISPLWNEFKLGRLNAGVIEMERMPTRLLTSDRSSVKASQSIREDLNQQDETFGYFMYWLLHDKLDTSRLETWRAFFGFAAAMGYNDLTQAQINWMITGNENGDLDARTDFSKIISTEPLDETIDIMGKTMTQRLVNEVHAQVIGNPEPQAQYPSRNTSPSAAPTDNSIHPDGSTGPGRANRMMTQGIPSKVINIPDPRFSRRGGVDVPNVRITTIPNPKYKPDDPAQQGKQPGEEGYEPPFITQEVPDIGAGSKDIGAMIESAESDRLLQSIPSKLYAPIHAQACDRYLGFKNYQRLSLPIDRYMKSYSRHPWGPTDTQRMYEWNVYTMALYGQMLYAFVTDVQMQRTSPVFDLSTPDAVGDEYMELNELVNELARFQQKADDRGARVEDSGAGREPLEDHLNKFFEDRDRLAKETLDQGNIAIISTGGMTPFPDSGGGGSGGSGGGGGDTPSPPAPAPVPTRTDWDPQGSPDPRYNKDEPYDPTNNDKRIDLDKPYDPITNDFTNPSRKPPSLQSSSLFSSMNTTNMKSKKMYMGTMEEMDNGIKRKNHTQSGTSSGHVKYGTRTVDPIVEKRNRMFSMFSGK